MNSQMSKLSLTQTNQFEKSRELLLANTSNSNFNMSGTLTNTLKFYTQPQGMSSSIIGSGTSPKNQPDYQA